MGSKDTFEIEQLERDLESALRPVSPRTEFVGHLRQRLIYPSPEIVDIRRPPTAFWVMLGVLAGIILTVVALGLSGAFRKSPKEPCRC